MCRDEGWQLATWDIESGLSVAGQAEADSNSSDPLSAVRVASALTGSGVPLQILPGGTGNLVASELRISTQIDRALSRICGETFETREIDVGQMGEHKFLLRVGCGIEPGVVQDATRELKNQFGKSFRGTEESLIAFGTSRTMIHDNDADDVACHEDSSHKRSSSFRAANEYG